MQRARLGATLSSDNPCRLFSLPSGRFAFVHVACRGAAPTDAVRNPKRIGGKSGRALRCPESNANRSGVLCYISAFLVASLSAPFYCFTLSAFLIVSTGEFLKRVANSCQIILAPPRNDVASVVSVVEMDRDIRRSRRPFRPILYFALQPYNPHQHQASASLAMSALYLLFYSLFALLN